MDIQNLSDQGQDLYVKVDAIELGNLTNSFSFFLFFALIESEGYSQHK